MGMKTLVSIVLCVLCTQLADAQQFDDYQLLKAEGAIPHDFSTYSYEKAIQARKEIPVLLPTPEKAIRAEFAVSSNYKIDGLLKSGRVLFGDPLSEYIAEVADQLLANEPELRSMLRFYAIKSDIANAFATHQGIIFVTTGLIARLENEAQLAFVLSHEIVHYEKRHVMNAYVREELNTSLRTKYKRDNLDGHIADMSQYSRALELQADSLGAIRFLASEYNANGISEIFDILLYSRFPYADEPFDYSCLEFGDWTVPASLRILSDSVNVINVDEEEDDEESTHPNVSARKTAIDAVAQSYEPAGTKLFIVGEEQFKNMRTSCRFENLHKKLLHRNYADAVYHAQLLLADYPESKFLKREMVKALYGIAAYKAQGRYGLVQWDEEFWAGQSHAVHHLMANISAEEMLGIALFKVDELCQGNATSPHYDKLKRHLVKLMYGEQFTAGFLKLYSTLSGVEALADQFSGPASFTLDETDTDVKSISVSKDEGGIKVTTTAIIEYGEEMSVDSTGVQFTADTPAAAQDSLPVDSVEEEAAFYDVLLANYAGTDAMLETIDDVYKELSAVLAEDYEEETRYDGLSHYEKRKVQNELNKKRRRSEWNLGIDSMVVVDPFCIMAHHRKGIQYEEAEKLKIKINKYVDKIAKRAKVNIDLVSGVDLEESDVDEFNNLGLVNTWIDEKFSHDEVDIIPMMTEDVKPMIDAFGTSKFYFSGLAAFKDKREDRLGIILTGIYYYYLFPFAVVYAFSPEYYLYYYSFMFDLESGELLTAAMNELNYKPNIGYINAMMYEQILQISK